MNDAREQSGDYRHIFLFFYFISLDTFIEEIDQEIFLFFLQEELLELLL